MMNWIGSDPGSNGLHGDTHTDADTPTQTHTYIQKQNNAQKSSRFITGFHRKRTFQIESISVLQSQQIILEHVDSCETRQRCPQSKCNGEAAMSYASL